MKLSQLAKIDSCWEDQFASMSVKFYSIIKGKIMEELNMELIFVGEKELAGFKELRRSLDFNKLSDFKKNKIEKRINRLEYNLARENPFHECDYAFIPTLEEKHYNI